jgi:hypothetical protein
MRAYGNGTEILIDRESTSKKTPNPPDHHSPTKLPPTFKKAPCASYSLPIATFAEVESVR